MRFAFFEDAENKIWRGILLPGLHDSFLWKDLMNPSEDRRMLDKASVVKILHKMRNKYYPLIEVDELQNFYLLGEEITRKNYYYLQDKNEYLIYMCTKALTEEYVKVQRQCKKGESSISLDAPINNDSKCKYENFFGADDVRLYNIEVEEFISCLSEWEKEILKILQDGEEEWKKRYNGTIYEKIILAGREEIRKKAYEYYGKEYLKHYED